MALSRNGGRRKSPEWMVVYLTYSVNEAHVVAGRLEHEGIPSMVHRQVGAGAIGITIGSLGEIRVLVASTDYERALDILESGEPAALPDSTDQIIYNLPESDSENDDE